VVSIVYKGLDSYICVPLKADNRVVGVIELLNQTSETSFAFSKLDEQFLEAFGSLAAIAIEYVRDYRSNVDRDYHIWTYNPRFYSPTGRTWTNRRRRRRMMHHFTNTTVIITIYGRLSLDYPPRRRRR